MNRDEILEALNSVLEIGYCWSRQTPEQLKVKAAQLDSVKQKIRRVYDALKAETEQADDADNGSFPTLAEMRGMAASEPSDEDKCTCHPDDNPPRRCPRKYAYSVCVESAARAAGFAAAKEMAAEVAEDGSFPFDIELWVSSTKKEMTAHVAIAIATAIRTLKDK